MERHCSMKRGVPFTFRPKFRLLLCKVGLETVREGHLCTALQRHHFQRGISSSTYAFHLFLDRNFRNFLHNGRFPSPFPTTPVSFFSPLPVANCARGKPFKQNQLTVINWYSFKQSVFKINNISWPFTNSNDYAQARLFEKTLNKADVTRFPSGPYTVKDLGVMGVIWVTPL